MSPLCFQHATGPGRFGRSGARFQPQGGSSVGRAGEVIIDAKWRIELFGELCASRGDQRVSRFRSQKMGALLAYLAYHLPRTHPRALLIEILWPGCDPELGRHNLNVALSRLREQLPPPPASAEPVFLSDRLSVGLNPALVTTDVAVFERELEAAAQASVQADRVRHLAAAVEQYRRPLLPGCYEEWIVPEQQRLDERFFTAISALIAAHEAAGDLERALQYARRAVSADPLREEAHRELMRLAVASDEPGLALRQYRELEKRLQQELGTTPSAATRALVSRIHRRDAEDAESDNQVQAASLQPRLTERTGHQAIRSGTRAAGDGHQDISPTEPAGGAVPLGSPYYVVRDTDARFAAAITRGDSLVLVKGPQQAGKTSLLARGLQEARQTGARVVLTNLESFNASQVASAEALLQAFAQTITDQLDLEAAPDALWDEGRGPNMNLQRFLRRHVLGSVEAPLVWGLDGVDRLFGCSFGTEIFALFRAWHNERALDPAGPWSRLTLAIAYAAEAHLFITDLNRSPFNVGTRLALDDFTLEQVADLNERYGAPLKDATELARYYALVGGHPYLVRRGLDEMCLHRTSIAVLEERAASETWIFGDHLNRMLGLATRDRELCDAVHDLLAGRQRVLPRSFYRLRSAGVLAGDAEDDARLRCRLYADYFARHLNAPP